MSLEQTESRLEKALRLGKQIRVAGVDDAPFAKERGSVVNVSAIICSNTRFEGMLWGEVTKDGADATEQLLAMLQHSKFIEQLHVVLIDGVAVGGFNIIDINHLAAELSLPCIAVMRKPPDFSAIDKALQNFADYARRAALIQAAGEVHSAEPFYFQTAGLEPDVAAAALQQLTDNGNVPEALRLAHLIGSAIKTGQSSQRA